MSPDSEAETALTKRGKGLGSDIGISGTVAALSAAGFFFLFQTAAVDVDANEVPRRRHSVC